jgi:hypothetical protein
MTMQTTDLAIDTAAEPAPVAAVPATSALLDDIRAIVDADLRPLTVAIDREGVYPETAFRRFGAAGAFRQHVPSVNGTGDMNLMAAIEAMAAVGAECMSTAFCMWCQDTLAWYLVNTDNQTLKDRLLPAVASADLLGGTGLSNPMKAFYGIEKLRLKGTPTDGGYVVSGTLPWVSNIYEDGYFATIFEVDGAPERRVMFCIDCSDDAVTIAQNARFTALDGTRTYSVRFKNYFVPDAMVLADPAMDYVKKVRAGFILLQAGMAFGLIEGCIDIMRQADKSHDHINAFLPERADLFEDGLGTMRAEVADLCADPYDPSPEYFRRVVAARLAASEWSLRAAQAAMLHAGARGYLVNAPAQRRLRESYFIAIVTPATKQLQKMLADGES